MSYASYYLGMVKQDKPLRCTERVYSSVYKSTLVRCSRAAVNGFKCKQHTLTPAQRAAYAAQLEARAQRAQEAN